MRVQFGIISDHSISIHLGIILEFLTLLFAVFYYKRLKGTFYVYAIPFLFFVFYAELGASYYIYTNPIKENPNGNTHIYLWISIMETIFYSCFFYQVMTGSFLRPLIKTLATLLVGAYLFLFFFYFSYIDLYYALMTLTGIYFTVLACVYFYQIFIGVEEENVIVMADFWMAAGIFVFYSGICLSFVLHQSLAHWHVKILGQSVYNFIPQVLSIILYGCFITAFILCKKKKTT